MKRAAVALGLLVLASSGCAKIREKLGHQAGDSAPSASAASGATGPGAAPPAVSVSTVSTKLPDGWPTSVPPYPGAAVQSATVSPNGKTVTLRTRDSSIKVREYYMDRLAAMKLQTDLTVPAVGPGVTGASTVMSFKDGGTLVTVTIAPTPTRETSVTLTIVSKG